MERLDQGTRRLLKRMEDKLEPGADHFVIARKCGEDRHYVQVGREQYPSVKAAKAFFPADYAQRVRFEYTVFSVRRLEAQKQSLKIVER